MANKYANLIGSNKIKDEYPKINTGFDSVEQDINAINSNSEIKDIRMNKHVDGIMEKHDAEDIIFSSTSETLPATNTKQAIEQIDIRVNSIIEGQDLDPNKDIELIDFRTSSIFGVFGNAKERGDASDKKIKELGLNVRMFGAKGDGINDDTQAIRDALEYAKSLYPNIPALFFPGGTYVITEMITINDLYRLTIIGEGEQYGTTITVPDSILETEPLEAMFRITGFRQGIYTHNIMFNGRGRAMKIFDFVADDVDGYGIRYSNFFKTAFWGLRKDGYGLYGLSWVVSVDKCRFVGYGDQSNPEHWRGTGIFISQAGNGVHITQSDFSRVEFGIDIPRGGNLINIKNNVFDAVKRSSVKIGGAFIVNIEGNYHEATGGEDYTVTVYGGAQYTINSCILLSGNADAWEAGPKNINIRENLFVGCRANDIISINHASGVTIDKNTVNPYDPEGSFRHNSFIRLFGHGIGYNGLSSAVGLRTSDNILYRVTNAVGSYPVVNKILDIEPPIYPGRENIGIVIKDTLLSIMNKNRVCLPINLLNQSIWYYCSSYFDIVVNDRNPEGWVYKLNKNTTPTTSEKSLVSDLDKVKGKYFRFTGLVKTNQQATPIRITLNDGVSSKFLKPVDSIADTWSKIEVLYYVDQDATKFTISFSTNGTPTTDLYVCNLQLTEACNDIGVVQEMPRIPKVSTPPLIGSWIVGDVVENSIPSAGGYKGWICVTSGNPGIWKGYGLIQA